MSNSQTNNYPFAQEFITDASGEIRKVIISIDDYRRLLQGLKAEELSNVRSHDAFLNGYAPEDEGLYDDCPSG